MAAEVWYWLASGLGWGAVNTGELLDAYPGGAEAVAADLGSTRLDEILTQKQAERLGSTRPEDFALRVRHAESMGLTVLGLDDGRYPAILRNIQNPPLVLFAKGDLRLLNGQLSIGMVGARRPSAYGMEAVKAIGRGVALGGAIIVSGLAAGLDAEAHKAALAVNGPTIACIAFGHDHCYPAANRKLMEVIERHGAVISEYPPGTGPEKPFFLQRNRVIAGLSHGLVVIEARRHSGTMSTVNFAVDYGRDVFAVPGSIFSELSGGTNAMLREGAYVASSAGDVLGVYGIELDGEDPVAAAAKQAVEGRPVAAQQDPPWQQTINRFAERARTEQGVDPEKEQLPGQQSLGELLRAQLAANGGEVTAAQAVDAFRSLQQKMPAKTDSELEARNRALDEMVEAVNDTVELSGRAPRAKKPEPAPEGPVPFPWHQVEHLDKSEVEDLSPAKEKRPAKRKSYATVMKNNMEAELGLAPKPAAKPAAQPSAKLTVRPQVSAERKQPPASSAVSHLGAAFSPVPVGRVEGVGRVEPISAVAPVAPVWPVAPVGPVAETAPAQDIGPVVTTGEPQQPQRPAVVREERPRQEYVPKPVADAPAPKPKADTSLASRLKTLQTAPPRQEAPTEKPRRIEQAQGGGFADSREQLSDGAQRALAQLGPVPVALDDICKRSGLSSAAAMAALTELELAGLSRQLAGRQFVAAEGV